MVEVEVEEVFLFGKQTKHENQCVKGKYMVKKKGIACFYTNI